MNFPKALAVVSGLVIGLTATVGLHASAASAPDEQWNLPINAPGQDMAELIGLRISAASAGLSQPSNLSGDSKGQGNRTDMLLCTSDSDPICSSAVRTRYEAYLPTCDQQTSINCISSVNAIAPDGREISGQFNKYFPAKAPNDFPGNPSRNLPAGSNPSVWNIPGVTHGGGTDTYLLRFNLAGSADRGASFHSDSIQVSLFPITTKSGNYTLGQMTDANHPSGACINDHYQCGGLGSEHSGNDESLSSACVSFDVGYCALRQAFPEGYRFKVAVRLGNSPTGWFHGRFFNPQISLNTVGNVTDLVVDASPVKVPAVGGYIKQSEMTPAMKAYYAKYPGTGSFGRLSPNGISNLIDSPQPSQPNIFEDYAVWSSIFNDKASATQSEWSFRTLELNGQNDSCFRDSTKLVGVVSTNAMMYSGGAPAFNKSEGTLDYKVGAPHYASNGDVFKGSYDLQLRSDVARCLYNFSNAPIKATVSIASDNGDSNVATTIVTEDKATGWLRMSASNFMFSNPTVKIKFTQEAPAPVASPSPSASPSATPVAQASSAPVAPKVPAKSTITCVKGKTLKTVTAVNPTCPAGYKKK